MTSPIDITWNDATEIPDYVSVSIFGKARPVEEGGQRFIFCEASNDAPDLEAEQMLQKALADSADYFLSKGNIDLEHLTIKGQQLGIAFPRQYEIGRPVEVRSNGDRTFVKGRIYAGQPLADQFWQSITEQTPPMPWFPSVGGAVLAKSTVFDPELGARKGVVKRVLWNNLAMSREPVNETVAPVSSVPLAAFAKAFAGAPQCRFGACTEVAVALPEFAKACACSDDKAKTCDCAGCRERRGEHGDVHKALAQGPVTTSLPDMTGGQALTRESLSGAPANLTIADDWQKYAVRFLKDLKSGRGPARMSVMGIEAWLRRNYHLTSGDAQHVARSLLETMAQRRRAA